MTSNFKHLLILIGLIFLSLGKLKAQLEVTNATVPPFTPENLIENVFLGAGVDVLSITFNGDPISVGYFEGDASNVGIDRGVLMTTGAATDAIGPNTAVGVTVNNNGGTDADLQTIAGTTINDAAVYTIEFIPYDDTLRFEYVFASDEYPEYACSNFNDAFGFFISGPGITGPYTGGAENIAIVPGSTLPVTINSINPGVPGASAGGGTCSGALESLAFSGMYVNNSPGGTVEYDGFTVPLEAVAVVTPCEVYTIKLAIGDVSDSAFDSGVFLKGNSFGTNALDVEVNTVSPDSTMVEGCVGASIAFTLGAASDADYALDYTIFGSAINGVDYDPVPLDIIIPAGSDSIAIEFNPIEDNNVEGRDTIYLDIQVNVCERDTFTIYIDDNALVEPIVDDTSICVGDTASIDGTLNMVLPTSTTFTSTTSIPIPDNDLTNPAVSTINVFGVSPDILDEGSVLSVCIDVSHTWIGDVDIYLVSPGGQFLELTTDNGGSGDNYTQTCFTEVAFNNIEGAINMDAPFTGDYNPEGPWSDIYGGPSNGIWQLILADDSNGLMGTLNGWSITFPPIYTVNYDWTAVDSLSCPDCPITDAYPIESTTYTVVATDTYGCFTTDTVRIEVIDNIEAPNISCDNSTFGEVTFSWDNIDAATSYEVNVDGTGFVSSNGTTSHTVTGLGIGQMVDIEVMGIGNCPGLIGTFSCTAQTCAFNSSIDNLVDVSCNGGSDGSITVSGTDGQAPYTFTLDGSTQASGTFTGLPAGNYTLQILDDNNCGSSQSFSIIEPTALSLATSSSPISCNSAGDGSAFVSVTGGTPNYSYSWDDPSGQTTATASNLDGGNYSVTVTDDNGCTAISSVNIIEPTALTLSLVGTDVDCNGAANGMVVATASGGTSTLTYDWSGTIQTTPTITGLSGGIYTVTITDVNNCTIIQSTNITEPTAIVLSTSNTPASCNGGSDGTATVSAIGGTGTYTFAWDANAGSQNSSTANNLPFGSYTVTVTDGNSCQATAIANVPEQASVVYTTAGSTLNCFGDANGTASINVTGGTPPFNFLWSNGSTDGTISNLTAGNYSITLTDGTGCNAVDNVMVMEPTEIMLQVNQTDALCFGSSTGTATVNASGGTDVFTYQWNDPLSQTTAIATNLSMGSYVVTVTDSNGCFKTIESTVGEPTILDLTTSATAVSCFNGSDGTLTVSGNGGTPNYTYNWSNGVNTAQNTISNIAAGIYTVTVTDVNNCSATQTVEVTEPLSPISNSISGTDVSCNGGSDGTVTTIVNGGTPNYTYDWSNGVSGTNNTISGLSVGTYFVTITDTNGCIFNDDVTLNEPIAISTTSSSTPESCLGNDGTATFVPSGGTAPYQFIWDNNQTDATATGLTEGDHFITITDSNGCEFNDQIMVSGSLDVSVSVTSTAVSCNGGVNGTASAIGSGGNGTYSFQWSDAMNQTVSTATGLSAGIYSVTVTDIIGCNVTETVEVTEPVPLQLSTTTTDVSCNGALDGSATVTAGGGVGPYTYFWNDMNTQTSPTATGLIPGVYVVLITDANACSATASVTIDQPGALVIDAQNKVDVGCNGENTGSAEVVISGGNPPYLYLWNDANSQTNASAINLSAGNYTVTITDQSGCLIVTNETITEPSVLTLSLTQTGAGCFGGADGSASATIGGGTPNVSGDYSILWSNGATTSSINNLVGGNTYSVTITDENNCSETASILIDQPAAIGLSSSFTDVNCFGGNDGTATVIINGGTAPYSYQWGNFANNQTTQTATGLAPGNYDVTITDNFGCSSNTSVAVGQASPIQLILDMEEVWCKGDSTGSVSVIATGGNPGYTFLWDDPDTTAGQLVENLAAGNYTVSVTDVNGCLVTSSIEVTEPQDPLSAVIDPINIACFGEENGQILVEGSGGTSPYTYSVDNDYYNGSNIIIGLASGDYTVYVKDSRGCIYTDQVNVAASPEFLIDAGPDQTIEFGDSVSIDVQSTISGDHIWEWTSESPLESLSCLDCPNPVSIPTFDITYFVEAITANGCIAEDEITIRVDKVQRVFVANAFTPNGDGSNDWFFVQGGKGTDRVLNFKVFDRWGEQVFEAIDVPLNQPDAGWNGTLNGKDMNPGVFAWFAEIRFDDGSVELYKGNVTLIR